MFTVCTHHPIINKIKPAPYLYSTLSSLHRPGGTMLGAPFSSSFGSASAAVSAPAGAADPVLSWLYTYAIHPKVAAPLPIPTTMRITRIIRHKKVQQEQQHTRKPIIAHATQTRIEIMAQASVASNIVFLFSQSVEKRSLGVKSYAFSEHWALYPHIVRQAVLPSLSFSRNIGRGVPMRTSAKATNSTIT